MELGAMSTCRLEMVIAKAKSEKMHYEAREITTAREQEEIDNFNVIWHRISEEKRRRGI
jgi:hypothetical protein